ncbi:hypothetical protein B296_00028858 [Ensete ventricosum]|uniref:Uncharacterized protein n=1 Tax=Ensete ventricosum TaxID=4639 RepID=A0A426YHZ8_ENSVE|nr:hypothetical protein B296_00028858 [Ensete ventricosum]
MLRWVLTLIVGFQRRKPEAYKNGLILYFLSEMGSRERDRPMFLFRLADLLLDLNVSVLFVEAEVLSRLGPTRVRKSVYEGSMFKFRSSVNSGRVFLLIQGPLICLFPSSTPTSYIKALVGWLWVPQLDPVDDQVSPVWSFECMFYVPSGRPLP